MQSKADSDVAGVTVPPIVYFLLAMVAAIVIDRFYASPWQSQMFPPYVGYTIVGLSFVWLWLVDRQFTVNRTPSNCSKTPFALITTGPFALSRNPSYVGFVAMMVGFALAKNNMWMLILVVPTWIAVDRLVVRKEEALLSRIFDDAYAEYRQRVRRWL